MVCTCPLFGKAHTMLYILPITIIFMILNLHNTISLLILMLTTNLIMCHPDIWQRHMTMVTMAVRNCTPCQAVMMLHLLHPYFLQLQNGLNGFRVTAPHFPMVRTLFSMCSHFLKKDIFAWMICYEHVATLEPKVCRKLMLDSSRDCQRSFMHLFML